MNNLLLFDLFKLPVIKRKRLSDSHYTYIVRLKQFTIGYTVNIADCSLMCIYLPVEDREVFAKTALRVNQWLGIFDDDNWIPNKRRPAYRVPKHLDSPIECKAWVNPKCTIEKIERLLLDVHTAYYHNMEGMTPPEDFPLDYYDTAWYY